MPQPVPEMRLASVGNRRPSFTSNNDQTLDIIGDMATVLKLLKGKFLSATRMSK
jgi:hypothetical protein